MGEGHNVRVSLTWGGCGGSLAVEKGAHHNDQMSGVQLPNPSTRRTRCSERRGSWELTLVDRAAKVSREPNSLMLRGEGMFGYGV